MVRVLGTERFGLIMFAHSFSVFFNIVVDFGFNLSATREIAINADNKKKISEIFSSVMTIKFLLMTVSFIALCFLVLAIPRLREDWTVYILSFGIVIGQGIFPVWYFQGIEKMSVITVLHVLAKLIFTILIILLIKSPSDFLMVPIFNSAGFIIAGGIGLVWALRKVKLYAPNAGQTKVLFKESASLFISNLSTTLYTYSNTLILGAFTNNATVGIYSSMEKLVLAIKSGFTPIYQSIFPYLSGKNQTEVVAVIKKMIPYIFSIGLFISLAFLGFSDKILAFIYADDQILAYSPMMQLLGTIGLLSGLSMLFNYLFLSTVKRYQVRMRIMLISGVYNVLMGLVLVQWIGIYGMAITAVSTEFLLLILGWYNFKKVEK